MATLGNIGERFDLLVRQGGTFGPHSFTLTNPDGSPLNLTGATLRGQIRRKALDPVVAADIVVTMVDPLLGKFDISLSSATTAGIVCGPTIKDPLSAYEWDFEMVDSLGRVIPLYYGEVKVFREVTRV